MEVQISADRAARDSALRRSRIEAELEADRMAREQILCRSRVDAEIRADKISSALAKSRLESGMQAYRIEGQRSALNESIRRSRVQGEVESILRRY